MGLECFGFTSTKTKVLVCAVGLSILGRRFQLVTRETLPRLRRILTSVAPVSRVVASVIPVMYASYWTDVARLGKMGLVG